MSAEEIEKDVQVEVTKRVIVTFSDEQIRKMLCKAAGVPANVFPEVSIEEWGDSTVIWEERVDG